MLLDLLFDRRVEEDDLVGQVKKYYEQLPDGLEFVRVFGSELMLEPLH